MAKTIAANEIQQGDLIKVTSERMDEDRKRTVSYEGVAHHIDPHLSTLVWRTEDDWSLYVSDAGVVIELLDRPKPKIKVPVGTYAQVTYTRNTSADQDRFAIRTPRGEWKCYDATGEWRDTKHSDCDMNEMLNTERLASNVKVIFEGVSK